MKLFISNGSFRSLRLRVSNDDTTLSDFKKKKNRIGNTTVRIKTEKSLAYIISSGMFLLVFDT